jgi:hypothetical protein
MWFEVRRTPARGLSGAHFLSFLLLAALAPGVALRAQIPDIITQAVDSNRVQALANHHPLWANPANSMGAAPANLPLNNLTLVLARSPQQEQAFEQFLANQQNPASPDFHHWLTPAQVGQRFGLSDNDIQTLTAWLQSEGLQVNWVSPSRVFIGFGGTAAQVESAFQTGMQYYKVNGEQRLSVSSDPMIPAALAPAIKAVRGMFTINDHPAHQAAVLSASPDLTNSLGNHYIAPGDFDTIYNVPSAYNGSGQTVGIVSWSRVYTPDLDNFRQKTGTTFADPTVVVPGSTYGGVDPGAACSTSTCSDLGGQEEATLDVIRVGSVAPGANILLVASSPAGSGQGIGADAQYMVNTTPVPVQVMSISFGECESEGGPSGVSYWDTLFQQAAAEGISVFVAAGDSGAAGCDTAFSAPPNPPGANSPNYICSSSYDTCVGGTEFNDAGSPSTYWSSSNNSDLVSALSYIPEGGWNESTSSSVAGTGGGVSIYITPTPSWQQGVTGVPGANAGRYMPDVAFSSAGHDGYFACMAAEGGSCVASGGSYRFIGFYGTSAAAPGMAGVAALLDQKQGAAQGNINPELYQLESIAPTSFNDVTVATSGVASCSISTASMCNNSVASRNGGSADPGYLVGSGFDEVTGLGSLNVQLFLNNFGVTRITPTVTVSPSPGSVTTAQSDSVTVSVSGGGGHPTPTGSVTLTSGSYNSGATALSGGSATIHVPAGSLATGSPTLTATYTPDTSSSSTYNSATGTNTVTVTTAAPTVTTGVASAVTSSTATLGGTVNPNGADTHAWFLWGTSSTLSGAAQTASQDLGSGTSSTPLSANLTGLTPNTKYYFEAVAQNGASTAYGGIVSFTTNTAPTPTVTTGTASAVTSSTATLGGTVNPNGYDTHAWFLYGTSSTLSGATQTSSQDLGSGTTATALTAPLTGLSANTTYYFEAVAQNSGGTVYGSIVSFTTSAVAPTVTTGTASAVTSSSATLGGTVNPNGADTHAWFLWGTSSTLSGATQTASQDLGSGTTATPLSANLIGLNQGTQYYFRAVAQNSASTSYGSIVSFTTTASSAPSFTINGTAVTIITPGDGTGNTSTITVTPLNGFTGSVTLTAQITASPNGAVDPPTFSFAPNPVSVTSASPVQPTMTVFTTATTTGALTYPARPSGSWYAAGGAALACISLFFVPRRRRNLRNLLGMVALLFVILGGVLACGGGSISGGGGSTGVAPAVTTGSASAITSSTATLGGTVNPNGADTHAWFLYGTSSTLSGATQTASTDYGSGTSSAPLSANITGLNGSTPYYFEAVAQNATGTSYGSIVPFNTGNPGTTPGNYTITVTGTSTSPAAVATGTVSLTVD